MEQTQETFCGYIHISDDDYYRASPTLYWQSTHTERLDVVSLSNEASNSALIISPLTTASLAA